VRSLRRAFQDLPHLNVRPPSASGCGDLPGVKLAGWHSAIRTAQCALDCSSSGAAANSRGNNMVRRVRPIPAFSPSLIAKSDYVGREQIEPLSSDDRTAERINEHKAAMVIDSVLAPSTFSRKQMSILCYPTSSGFFGIFGREFGHGFYPRLRLGPLPCRKPVSVGLLETSSSNVPNSQKFGKRGAVDETRRLSLRRVGKVSVPQSVPVVI
jgi:hypothetical protein